MLPFCPDQVPKEILCGSAPIRMSLGSCSDDEARQLAAQLAEQARLLFHDVKKDLAWRAADADREPASQDLKTGQRPDKIIAEIRENLRFYLEKLEASDGSSLSTERMSGAGSTPALLWNDGLIGKVARDALDELMIEFKDLIRMKMGTGFGDASPFPPPLQMPEPAAQSEATNSTAIQIKPVRYKVHGRPDLSSGPAFHLDRRQVPRRESSKPKFSVRAAEYVARRQTARGKADKDVQSAKMRLKLFVDLIGDHPVDTYNGTDLQAYVELMQYWPSESHKRAANAPPLTIIERNRDLHLKPVAYKTLQEG